MGVNKKSSDGEKKFPIALRCKVFREYISASQEALSIAMGKSIGWWGHFELGIKLPRGEHLIALYGKYGLDPTWLLTGEGEMLRGKIDRTQAKPVAGHDNFWRAMGELPEEMRQKILDEAVILAEMLRLQGQGVSADRRERPKRETSKGAARPLVSGRRKSG